MFPKICTIGPFTIYSYGVMFALSVGVCSWLIQRDSRRWGIQPDVIVDFAFWVVLSGILGARIFYILLNLGFFLEDPKEMIMIQNGGLAWQGGLILGMTVGIFYLRRRRLLLRETLDLCAPYVALGHPIGRIGCFLNGCCYGKEVSWGIYFPIYHAHLHPTQLYESAALFLIFVILKQYQKFSPKPIPGQVFVFYLILASLERFGVEFLRADHTWTWLGLSIFQWISLAVMAAAVYAYSIIQSRSGK